MTTSGNPFTFGSMITDPAKFVGRQSEREQIVARLNGSQPQGSAVVGPRRIGKSSLLHYLYQPRPDEQNLPAANLHVLYFSAADGQCSTPAAFRLALAQALLRDLSLDRRTTVGGTLAGLRERLGNGTACGWGTCTELLVQLHQLPEPRHPVICLDEFEALLHDGVGFDDRFFDALRNWANEGLLTWVTASAKPLQALRTDHGLTSPFFNVLATIPLGELTDVEANQLLSLADNTTYIFTSKERKRLRKLAGTNPYHLQIVAWRLWEMKKTGRVNWKGLRRFLCEQPSPPELCHKRRIDLNLHHLAWPLVIVLMALLYSLNRSVRDFVTTFVVQPFITIWGWLGSFGDGLGGLIAIIVIAVIVIGGIRKRKKITQILSDLWSKLS